MNEIAPSGQNRPLQRGKVGRPTMLNLNKAYCVMHSMRETGSIEGAAAMNGISATTYYNWLRHGKRMAEREAEGHRLDPEDEPFAILYRNVNEALAFIEARNFEIVQAAAQGRERDYNHPERPPVWQAAAWILERRFPDRWGRRYQGEKPSVNIKTDRLTISNGVEAGESNPSG